ncbi:hypothetical protein M433DRAFT_59493 [Acidomyces richmondensis BFW]|nr:MAG: hypothetical protein FE78DRAFT_155831 [Acidomyces sp. 'richmondensis']KYG49245.1 hypothetical protein M433DRAFT_59493 [Acidomyces richmondensis BFW]
MSPHRILYLDAYDSFSNNIIALLNKTLPVSVECIQIDDPRFVFNDDAFQNFLNKFDAVVAGPGPGHPANPADVGLIGKLWNVSVDRPIPVLGICLGFQSLALYYGARVEGLKEPRHGLVRSITHRDISIFAGLSGLEATQYHSLHVRLSSEGHEMIGSDLFVPTSECPDLEPLAWDTSDVSNGAILMGARHVGKPLWGVQFHPESICSQKGSELVKNWWREVIAFRKLQHRDPEHAVKWKAVKINPDLQTSAIAEKLWDENTSQPILLESGVREGKPLNPETGRFSIIGVPDKSALNIRWSVAKQELVFTSSSDSSRFRPATIIEALEAIENFLDQHRAHSELSGIPFWGGLIGFISYEAGLQTINVTSRSQSRPDILFVMVERSVVIDHITHMAYIQSIRMNDDNWLNLTQQAITLISERVKVNPVCLQPCLLPGTLISGPDEATYCQKIGACQDFLRAGESYELCLTDQTLIRNAAPAWSLFQDLRLANPAPFGSYMRLGGNKSSDGVTILSSSPERFLSWSREGICQLRPIKGTVKKTPKISRVQAEALLASEKEQAENLMIVDLIRHDLHGVEGVRNVHVPKLMSVEEYETVYQLVSVIEGDISHSKSRISALAQSLPPGSMTGAPKKRSCELLQQLEGGKPRGLYSGVIGYLDVGGGADFSVVIRTAFKWDGEGDVWRVGAGGAITALSEIDAEWHEMLTKRQSVLGVIFP